MHRTAHLQTPLRQTALAGLVASFLALSIAGCTDTPSVIGGGHNAEQCDANQVFNPTTGECQPSGGGENGGEDNGGEEPEPEPHPWEGRENLDPWGDESGDGIPNQYDNCPFHYNPDQLDSDGDGIGDVCDNCPFAANPGQESHPNNPLDERGIRMGDVCAPGVIYIDTEIDSSGDGVPDVIDNCPDHFNPDQLDSSGDGVGDVCDNCPNHFNPTQTASPGNPVDSRGIVMGDACVPEPINVPICANQTSEFERLQPNVYISLDLSGSMNRDDTPSGQTRMREALDGMNAIADSLAGDIRFGLGTFPHPTSGQSCSIAHILDIGQYTSQFLKNTWANYSPTGCTPTLAAMRDIRDNGRFDYSDPTAVNAVLLITDGEPNCGGGTCSNTSGQVAGVNNVISDLYSNGVLTFVVGFKIDSSTLNTWAATGGTGDPFLAVNATELANAVEDVANLLISCSFELQSVPQDPNKVWVKVDGEYLDRADYTYISTMNVVELSSNACDQIRGIDADEINMEIELGCADDCVPEEPSGLLCDLYYETCGQPYPCDECSPEICDGQDNNCDGNIDENCPDCGIFEAPCETNADCCEPFVCNDGTCGHACYPTGVSCSSNSQCCTGLCGGVTDDQRGICITG